MRLIQIGLGGFGRSWAKLAHQADGVQLVAAVDPDPAARARAADDLDPPPAATAASLEAALAAHEADAVLVVTPPETHAAVAAAALAAGKHVLVEKPLATTLEDARALVATADQAGKTLMVSQNYRFRPPARAAEQAVADGLLGEIVAVRIGFRRDTRTLFPPGNFRYTMRHPLLVDMTIHHADLLRAVTGQEVTQVFARGWRVPDSPYQHDPAVVLVMALDNGATATYEGDWATRDPDTSWNADWELLGERGRLRWTGGVADALTGELSLAPHGEPPRRLDLPTLPAADRLGALRAFRQAVEHGTEPETSGRDNLGSLAIVLAGVASLERGVPISVAPWS